ncbi:hypothetical protein LTR37_015268 [Vermiconidia calcicola]|uniref:Uncharacterized protein n=1 Tax=Vermiconidia calcicola TaxID=1690605 RepID=A0ACC3MRD6_9PEZI|nr:hypothetical protein LTR37_015268 [Vermiconidia calcicola]
MARLWLSLSAFRAIALMMVQRSCWTQASMEPVFGLELTMSGAVCAVSLPDGRIETLAFINGSDQYVHLMHEWYDLYNTTAEPGEITAMAEDRYPKPEKKETGYISERWESWLDGRHLSWKEQLEYWLGWKRRDLSEVYSLDFYPTDEPTAILSRTIKRLRDAVFRALRNDTAQTLPGWFFARLPVFENDGDPDVREEMMIHSSHMFALTSRILVAAHRAGFRNSFDKDPLSIMSEHFRPQHPDYILSSPSLAITQASLGDCQVEA